jgi:hypothetical protein
MKNMKEWLDQFEERLDQWFATKDFGWFRHFIGESDRGSVLIAQGILEERLGDLIEMHILGTKGTAEKLVAELRKGRNNPIGSFAACVDYAESCGLVRKWAAHTLREINKIRVAFAHYKPPYTLTIEPAHAQSVCSHLPKIVLEKRIHSLVAGYGNEAWAAKFSEARRTFLAVAWMLMFMLEASIHPLPIVSRTRSSPSTATE